MAGEQGWSPRKDVQPQLRVLQKRYTEVVGQPFRHFFCPILWKDEPTELCLGHVVNGVIPNSCRKRVVQRADVDRFFGKVVEPDFITVIAARSTTPLQVLTDRDLNDKIRPQIIIDGKKCPHYHYRGGQTPADHSRMLLEAGKGPPLELVLRKSPEGVSAALGKKWEIVLEKDCRIAALASLIKAGYLTLFRLLGYRYALSSAGLSVGYEILGRFYRQNCTKEVSAAKEAARDFFAPYVNMVRPISGFSGTAPLGTVEDNVAMACFGSSGNSFAMVVCVRTNKMLHAVLMPTYDNAESAATFQDYLTNDNDTLRANYCQYDAKADCWRGTEQPVEMHWPKGDVSFQFA
jgi:hypothetical protein